jgi:hypothetical protein
MEILVEHLTLFGFDFQNWMLIAMGLLVAYIIFVWRARSRN